MSIPASASISLASSLVGKGTSSSTEKGDAANEQPQLGHSSSRFPSHLAPQQIITFGVLIADLGRSADILRTNLSWVASADNQPEPSHPCLVL